MERYFLQFLHLLSIIMHKKQSDKQTNKKNPILYLHGQIKIELGRHSDLQSSVLLHASIHTTYRKIEVTVWFRKVVAQQKSTCSLGESKDSTFRNEKTIIKRDLFSQMSDYQVQK